MDNISKKIEGENVVEDPSEHVSASRVSEFDMSQVAPEDLDSLWLRWKCLVCGYVYEGASRIKVCPKCGNEDPDKFDDAE